MAIEDEHETGPGPLKLLGRYAAGLSIGVTAGAALSTFAEPAATVAPDDASGSSLQWVLALLTITLGGVAVMAIWAFLSGWLDEHASRHRAKRRKPRRTEARQVPYWLQVASTIVGMVTGIVGMVIGLAG